MNRITLLSVVALFGVASCESAKDHYDRGYEDGLAAGRRVQCEGEVLASAGDVSDQDYLAGYQAGYSAVTEACETEGAR